MYMVGPGHYISSIMNDTQNNNMFNEFLQVYFGQNLVCQESLTEGKGKTISVGDCVYVFNKASSAAEAAA